MMMLTVGVLVYIFSCCSAQVHEEATDNPCISKYTCGECITADRNCAWCSEQDYGYEGKRCNYIENVTEKCPVEDIVSSSFRMLILKDLGFHDKVHGGEKFLQMKPQEIKLTLPPNWPVTVYVDILQGQNYPVDLYYLTDLSSSMKNRKDSLVTLAEVVYEDMKRTTENFRIGLGSFVGKAPEKSQESCSNCRTPYGFFNQVPLSYNLRRVSQMVTETPVSENVEASGGGFDAVMQAVICNREIQWRRKSKKILLFASDSSSRYAGDGKVDGISTPNDGFCHLDSNGHYTESSTQDYPSLSHINQKIKENEINIIFAVTENQVPFYESISDQLEGSAVAKLQDDHSDILRLLKAQYDNIRTTLELKDNAEKLVRVTYSSKCHSGSRIETHKCEDLKLGSNVTFIATIELTSCPKDRGQWNEVFHIYPVGSSESLTVRLEMTCECDCQKPENRVQNHPKCSSSKATYECGVCSDVTNKRLRTGEELIECDRMERIVDAFQCSPSHGVVECSGRGTCVCGKCDCFKRSKPEEEIYGHFCECDNFSCDRVNGKLCGGPERGRCVCGMCQCNPNWTGLACECSTSVSSCTGSNGEICSGRGDCICDLCRCHETEGRFEGRLCERCPTCPTKCEEYKHCVECQMFYDETEVPPENCSSCPFITIGVDKLEVNQDGDVEETLCIFRDHNGCKFVFKYKFEEHLPVVIAQRVKDCSETETWNPMAVVLCVTEAALAIFLVVLPLV